MLQNFSADWVFPVSGAPVKNGVVGVSDSGTITYVYNENEGRHLTNVQKFKGAIVPGFINTHCHLELSHMRGMLPERTGLIQFIKNILSKRDATDEAIINAAVAADNEMFRNGIVAVGDISNRSVTSKVKMASKLYYYTFLEVLGIRGSAAQQVMDTAIELQREFSGLHSGIVPHAPYSVSLELLELIANVDHDKERILSIHNQETEEENSWFESGTGDFIDFYDMLGIDLSAVQPLKKRSINYYLPSMPAHQRLLLVHNTVSNADDIVYAGSQKKDLYWCLCPSANLYIENKLPDTELMIGSGIRITLGTDSLASNHQLNILKEMQVLQQHKKVGLTDLLLWGTLNGAE
ncbi:MAG: amidohydrolase, partial [Chitinophagaceae bacterium]